MGRTVLEFGVVTPACSSGVRWSLSAGSETPFENRFAIFNYIVHSKRFAFPRTSFYHALFPFCFGGVAPKPPV